MLRQPGVPPHNLRLKIGAVCSVMRNISTDIGLVKNARVVVVNLARRYVEVRLLFASLTDQDRPRRQSSTYCLPRITFEFKPLFAPWTVRRQQIPLRLAYSTTFNSCQGLTLDRCVLDLRTPVFAHGQLYTSISRVRNRTDVRALFPGSIQTTTNIVYPELLL